MNSLDTKCGAIRVRLDCQMLGCGSKRMFRDSLTGSGMPNRHFQGILGVECHCEGLAEPWLGMVVST